MGLNKTGKTQLSWTWVLIILAVAYAMNVGGLQDKFSFGGTPAGGGDQGQESVSLCPTDGDSTLKLDVRNKLNTTGVEKYDNTVYVFGSNGAIEATLTDTTSPTGTAVNCGETYTLKAVATDALNGDNSKFLGLDYPSNDGVTYNSADGTISFSAEKSTVSIGAQASQHGLLKFKLWDNDGAAWVFDDGDTAATDYEYDGVNYNSSTTGTLGFTLDTSTTSLSIDLKVAGNETDTDFTDHYVLVAIEAPVTEYNEPSAKWDGAILSEATGLTSEETTQLSSYEYVYKLPTTIGSTIHDFNFDITTLAGVDASTDLQIDFYSAGGYLSSNGNTVKVGTAQDDSAKTAVFTVQDVTIQIV